MTWRDALWAVSIDFVNAADPDAYGVGPAYTLGLPQLREHNAERRFELDESAFMEAVDIPLFLQKSDSELRELLGHDR